jgi:tungstate transport system ATP-binding protein
MHNTHLYFSGIGIRFGQQQVLTDTELEIVSGRCNLLCGKNGSGKTTLLRIIAGLQVPDSCLVNTGIGKYDWDKYRQQLRQTTVYLHQQPYMFDGDVISNLNFSLNYRLTRKQRIDRINSAIEWAELESIAKNPAKTLSGGERQRVAIARAWLRNPEILLLDEPITSMDQDSRLRTIQLLINLKQQGVALVVSSHDPVHFGALSDTLLQISEGRVHRISTSDNVTPIHYRKHLSKNAKQT